MRPIIPIFIMSVLVLLAPLCSYAQLGSNHLTLELSPQLPEANGEFTIKLTGNNDNRVSTQWFINGTENTTFKNQDSISLQAGDIGLTTNIYAKVTLFNGSVLEAKRTVTPNRVDLIIEADTTVPAFYSGRKLPSSGSKVTATAFVFTKEKQPSSEYSYSWKLNNKVQGNTQKGRNTFSFVPLFEKEILLSVDVSDRTGRVIASKSQVIPIVEPELYFYEKNPLRGLSIVALTNPYIFIGEEITLEASEYFMNDTIQGADLLTEWKIDGKIQNNTNSLPREITLNKEGNNGSVELSYHIRNLNQLLQGVKKSLEIKF